MRIAYGEGVVVVLLLPFVLYFLGVLSISHTLFFSILLLGAWTMISAFLLVSKNENKVYLAWGLVIASASAFFITSVSYAIAILLIAIIASVIIFVLGRKT